MWCLTQQVVTATAVSYVRKMAFESVSQLQDHIKKAYPPAATDTGAKLFNSGFRTSAQLANSTTDDFLVAGIDEDQASDLVLACIIAGARMNLIHTLLQYLLTGLPRLVFFSCREEPEVVAILVFLNLAAVSMPHRAAVA